MLGITDIYKSLYIGIGTVMKNSVMKIRKLKIDHLKTRKCVSMKLKLPYLLGYVPDRYKTQ